MARRSNTPPPLQECGLASDRYAMQINGPLFRQQRLLLSYLVHHRLYPSDGRLELTDHGVELLEGLMNMLDEVADQAHDRFRIDCLVSESQDYLQPPAFTLVPPPAP